MFMWFVCCADTTPLRERHSCCLIFSIEKRDARIFLCSDAQQAPWQPNWPNFYLLLRWYFSELCVLCLIFLCHLTWFSPGGSAFDIRKSIYLSVRTRSHWTKATSFLWNSMCYLLVAKITASFHFWYAYMYLLDKETCRYIHRHANAIAVMLKRLQCFRIILQN